MIQPILTYKNITATILVNKFSPGNQQLSLYILVHVWELGNKEFLFIYLTCFSIWLTAIDFAWINIPNDSVYSVSKHYEIPSLLSFRWSIGDLSKN